MAKRIEPKLYCVRCMRPLRRPLEQCPVCHTNNATAVNPPYLLPERNVLAGKYLVGAMLGQGGFGITYIGLDLNLDVKVAIKEYYPADCVCREQTGRGTIRVFDAARAEDFAHGRDRFLLEARVLARMDYCEGVVHVRDVFGANGTAYIVMDFVEGKTLKQLLAEAGGKLPASQVLPLLLPVIRSMEQVHRQMVLHRDISPDNIMVTPQGKAVLLDFGAARYYSEEHPDDTKSVNVKHGYAPLEQYDRHGKQGPWTDVYAMCATIYKAITGITPPSAIRLMMQSEELTPPTKLGADLTDGQEEALLKGLASNKVQRIADMDTLFHALGGDDFVLSEAAPEPEAPDPLPETNVSAPRKPLLGKISAVILAVALLTLGVVCFVPELRQTMLSGVSFFAETNVPPSEIPATITVSAQAATPHPAAQPSSSPTPTVSPTPTPRITPTPTPEIISSTNDAYTYRNDQENLLSVHSYTGAGTELSMPLFYEHYLVHGVTGDFSATSPNASTWTSVKLPVTIVSVEDGAFRQCVSLRNVSGGENMESIGKAAFEGTPWLTQLRKNATEGRVIALGKTLLDVVGTHDTLVLNEQVAHVGHDALQGNGFVRTIRIVAPVTLEVGAFAGCSSLERIELQANCTLLGNPFGEDAPDVEITASGALINLSEWERYLPKNSTLSTAP